MRSLSEADAVAVALEWATRLTAHAGDSLQLDSVQNALLPVLDVAVATHWDDRESFEVDKKALAALRETLGVWRALSCCRGFGGYENPRFWDTMVRQFVRNYGGIEELGRHDFHDEAATPSRVTLKVTVRGKVSLDDSDKQRVCDWMRSVCRELFQLNESKDAMPLSAEYQRTLQRLQPFIDEQQFSWEAVSARLVFEAWKAELQEYADPEILQTYTSILNEIAAKPAARNAAPTDAPRLILQDVGLDTLGISTKSELEAFNATLARNPFPIRHLRSSIHPDVDPSAFSEFVTTILQTKELSERGKHEQIASPGKLQALTLLLSSRDRYPLASFFSALPYTQSLHCLRLLEMQPGGTWELSKYECSWLAYACFHPRSKTSSWNDLWLDPSSLADDGRVVLKDIHEDPSRALSVTRLAVVSSVVSKSEVRSDDRLQIATVNKHAAVYTRASVEACVLITLGEETELEMCDLHSNDWHCVLVPGYGFGWVSQSDVADIREWTLEAPVSSSLKSLEVPSTFGVEDGLLLLSAIGSTIETLTLSKKCASGGVMDQLMLRCPKLKSLTLEVQEKQILSANREESNVPELLEILTNQTDSEAAKRVKMLRVTNITPHAFSPTKVAALEAMLLANHSLEQLLLTSDDKRRPSWDMRTPGAELEKHHGEIVHRSQHLKQRWAFLSVTNRRVSTRSQLDSAVIAMIFEFATLPVRRLVHLSPLVIDDEW